MSKQAQLYGSKQKNRLASGFLFLGFLALALVITFASAFVNTWMMLFQAALSGVPIEFLKPSAWERTTLLFQHAWYHPIVLTCLWLLIVILFHRRLILWGQAVHNVSSKEEPALFREVDILAIQTGMMSPRIWVMEVTAKNAFSIALWGSKANIVVTRGLLDALTPKELRAVLAHEFSHIRNEDSCLYIVSSVFTGSLLLLSGGQTFARLSLLMSPIFLLLLLAKPQYLAMVFLCYGAVALIFGVLSLLTKAAISKSRDLIADINALEFTHDPEALVSALDKIKTGCALPLSKLFDPLLFAPPPASAYAKLLGTADRIEAINELTTLPNEKVGENLSEPRPVLPPEFPVSVAGPTLARTRTLVALACVVGAIGIASFGALFVTARPLSEQQTSGISRATPRWTSDISKVRQLKRVPCVNASLQPGHSSCPQ